MITVKYYRRDNVGFESYSISPVEAKKLVKAFGTTLPSHGYERLVWASDDTYKRVWLSHDDIREVAGYYMIRLYGEWGGISAVDAAGIRMEFEHIETKGKLNKK